MLRKIARIMKKIEHKHLKNIYLGKDPMITIKKKGLRKDSPKRKAIEKLLNYVYLKNYGKIKQAMINSLIYGEEVKIDWEK
jgi:hypothetical protein